MSLKPGSTDFGKKGGYFCNSNPCHSSKHVGLEDFFDIHGDTAILADEIGPGSMECCMYFIPPVLILATIYHCLYPINLHGYVFRYENNQVNCEVYNKHCCYEDRVIKFENVVDVKAVECRRREVPRSKHDMPHVRIYEQLHVSYRLPSGEVKTYTSTELKRFHRVDYIRRPGMMGFLGVLDQGLEPVGESHHALFCKEIQRNLIARTTASSAQNQQQGVPQMYYGGAVQGAVQGGAVQMQTMNRGGNQYLPQQQVVQTGVVVGVCGDNNKYQQQQSAPIVVIGTIVTPV